MQVLGTGLYQVTREGVPGRGNISLEPENFIEVHQADKPAVEGPFRQRAAGATGSRWGRGSEKLEKSEKPKVPGRG